MPALPACVHKPVNMLWQKTLAPGKWVLVECFGDNEGEMWLGRVVATKEPDSTAMLKCKREHNGRQQRIKGTRHDRDD